MKVINVSANCSSYEKNRVLHEDAVFLAQFEFHSSYDDDSDDYFVKDYYLLQSRNDVYELLSLGAGNESDGYVDTLLYCKIESGELDEIAQLMLCIHFHLDKEYSNELIADDIEVQMSKAGLILERDLNSIMEKIDLMTEYFSGEYNLYGLFSDKKSGSGQNEEILVYGLSNVIALADSLDADNVYFGCYDNDDGLLYFKDDGYIGTR